MKTELEFLQSLLKTLLDRDIGWMLRISKLTEQIKNRINELTKEEEE